MEDMILLTSRQNLPVCSLSVMNVAKWKSLAATFLTGQFADARNRLRMALGALR